MAASKSKDSKNQGDSRLYRSWRTRPDRVYEGRVVQFLGQPVKDWKPESKFDAKNIARVRFDEELGEPVDSLIEQLAETAVAKKLKGLVIGTWFEPDSGESIEPVITALIAHKDRFSSLEHLFLGDVISEELYMSYIEHCNLEELMGSFGGLKTLVVRGTNELEFGNASLDGLERLVIEATAPENDLIEKLVGTSMSSMQHLELWLGEEIYVEALNPIFTGQLLPRLKYLGLRNSEWVNDIAEKIANSPVLSSLMVLDLSLGCLDDVGSDDLLKSPYLKGLEELDLHHHYISEEGCEALHKVMGDKVNTSSANEKDYGQGLTAEDGIVGSMWVAYRPED